MAKFPLNIPSGTAFPLGNIPFGIFSPKREVTFSTHGHGEQHILTLLPYQEASKRGGTIIGDSVVDLALLEKKGLFANVSKSFGNIFSQARNVKHALYAQNNS